MNLQTITKALDNELLTKSIPDASMALNGLQLQNNGTVTRVAVAVDGSELCLQKAIDIGADLLILHHGIFWQKMQPITDVAYRKLKLAMEHNLAIYSAHLPLDIHPELGNNAILAKKCNIEQTGNGFDYHGVSLGLRGQFHGTGQQLINQLSNVLGITPNAYWVTNPNELIGDVFVCSGGAGDELDQVAKLGCQTYITGEGSHWNIPLAAELGINLIYGGHYHTETFGVKALGEYIKKHFQIDYTFIDLPPTAYSVTI
ncbi:MAG: Nif3-like dinuclear metal center hexameric protein [Akkermansia sp.]|nr:Nif3-like dinuclear metal center hexameric protein [Akkermansia sp.]